MCTLAWLRAADAVGAAADTESTAATVVRKRMVGSGVAVGSVGVLRGEKGVSLGE